MTAPNIKKEPCAICGRVPRNIVRPRLAFREVGLHHNGGLRTISKLYPAGATICPGEYIHDEDGIRRASPAPAEPGRKVRGMTRGEPL